MTLDTCPRRTGAWAVITEPKVSIYLSIYLNLPYISDITHMYAGGGNIKKVWCYLSRYLGNVRNFSYLPWNLSRVLCASGRYVPRFP